MRAEARRRRATPSACRSRSGAARARRARQGRRARRARASRCAGPLAPTERASRGSRRTGSRGRSRRSDGRRRRARPAAAVDATSPSDGERTDSNASASAAGTSSWRAAVAGRERNTYAPPRPGAKQIIATCAPAVTPAAQVRRKSAQPASNATTTASGARIDGRWTTTRSGSSPATFAINAMKPCQSGKA